MVRTVKKYYRILSTDFFLNFFSTIIDKRYFLRLTKILPVW